MDNRILIQNEYLKSNNHERNTILKKISKNYEKSEIADLTGNDLIEFLEEVEKFEFEKIYSYSVIYNCFEIEKLFEISLKNDNTIFNRNKFDNINTQYEKPTLRVVNENVIDVKFSLKKKNKNGDSYKYPIVITFFKDLKIGIIKFSYLDGEEEKYIEICKKIEKWFNEKVDIKIKPHRTFPIVENIMKTIDKRPQFLKFVIQALDPNHGKIKLRMNQQDILPLLGSIEELAKTFSNPQDKEKIMNFLKDVKEKYTYLTIGLIHQTFFKTGSVYKKLRFIFLKDYLGNEGYTFIHLHSTGNLREDFENAIRDIINS